MGLVRAEASTFQSTRQTDRKVVERLRLGNVSMHTKVICHKLVCRLALECLERHSALTCSPHIHCNNNGSFLWQHSCGDETCDVRPVGHATLELTLVYPVASLEPPYPPPFCPLFILFSSPVGRLRSADRGCTFCFNRSSTSCNQLPWPCSTCCLAARVLQHRARHSQQGALDCKVLTVGDL